jgi:hypothetical protein
MTMAYVCLNFAGFESGKKKNLPRKLFATNLTPRSKFLPEKLTVAQI